GQQQRVALGRALVRDPAVFLMDEPLSNLDAKLRVQMRSELKRFHQDLEATVIYVTHDQLEAVTMADKMAVMNGGLLQQYDAPAEVFAHPANTFVASFVGSPAMNLVPLKMVEANGQIALASPEGWQVWLSPERAQVARRASTNAVILGARHSTIRLHKSAVPGAVAGQAYIVEPSVSVAPDEPVWIEFDQSKIHLFDGETQNALT